LHHQLLAFRVELLVADGPGITLPCEFRVAAIRFLEIYLTLPKIHIGLSLSVRLFPVFSVPSVPASFRLPEGQPAFCISIVPPVRLGGSFE
jgi:hypothetical protein